MTWKILNNLAQNSLKSFIPFTTSSPWILDCNIFNVLLNIEFSYLYCFSLTDKRDSSVLIQYVSLHCYLYMNIYYLVSDEALIWVEIPRGNISRTGNVKWSLPNHSDFICFICLVAKRKTWAAICDLLFDIFKYLDFMNKYFQRSEIQNASTCYILPLDEWEDHCVCYSFFLWSSKTSGRAKNITVLWGSTER